jgi:hypothetical protein
VALWRLIASCLLAVVASASWADPERPAVLSSERCLEAFAEHRRGGHDWRSHPEMLRVRQVRGRVTNDVGGWPDRTRVVFQTFGPATRPLLHTTTAAVDGAFLIEGLAPGKYCFEASAAGWDPVEGLLEVSSTSPKEATIELTLPLAR